MKCHSQYNLSKIDAVSRITTNEKTIYLEIFRVQILYCRLVLVLKIWLNNLYDKERTQNRETGSVISAGSLRMIAMPLLNYIFTRTYCTTIMTNDSTLLDKFWRILLYVTDDAIAKLDVTWSFVQLWEMVKHLVTVIS